MNRVHSKNSGFCLEETILFFPEISSETIFMLSKCISINSVNLQNMFSSFGVLTYLFEPSEELKVGDVELNRYHSNYYNFLFATPRCFGAGLPHLYFCKNSYCGILFLAEMKSCKSFGNNGKEDLTFCYYCF